MTCYETIKKTDGTLELSSASLVDLKKKGYASEQIFSGLLKLYNLTLATENKPVSSGDMNPCSCGSVDFIPTGNCHVCAVCGESQGCS